MRATWPPAVLMPTAGPDLLHVLGRVCPLDRSPCHPLHRLQQGSSLFRTRVCRDSTEPAPGAGGSSQSGQGDEDRHRTSLWPRPSERPVQDGSRAVPCGHKMATPRVRAKAATFPGESTPSRVGKRCLGLVQGARRTPDLAHMEPARQGGWARRTWSWPWRGGVGNG